MQWRGSSIWKNAAEQGRLETTNMNRSLLSIRAFIAVVITLVVVMVPVRTAGHLVSYRRCLLFHHDWTWHRNHKPASRYWIINCLLSSLDVMV